MKIRPFDALLGSAFERILVWFSWSVAMCFTILFAVGFVAMVILGL